MVVSKHALVESDDEALKPIRKPMIETMLHVIGAAGHPSSKQVSLTEGKGQSDRG